MDICYVDEAGGPADVLRKSIPNSTPVFVLAAVLVPAHHVTNVQWDFLQLKKEFNPKLAQAQRLSDVISTEVKGSDLRSDLRSGSHRRERRARAFVAKTLDILEARQCRLLGRVLVKRVDGELHDPTIYGSSISWICDAYHRYLNDRNSDGILVLDSRTKVKNTPNSAVIVTQKFRSGGDPLHRLREIPLFGHSDSHVGLQIADIVASALLFPMACSAYCGHLGWNLHAAPAFDDVRRRFGARVQGLQYRYEDVDRGMWRGGIYSTGGVSTARLFTAPTTPSPQLPFPSEPSGPDDVR